MHKSDHYWRSLLPFSGLRSSAVPRASDFLPWAFLWYLPFRQAPLPAKRTFSPLAYSDRQGSCWASRREAGCCIVFCGTRGYTEDAAVPMRRWAVVLPRDRQAGNVIIAYATGSRLPHVVMLFYQIFLPLLLPLWGTESKGNTMWNRITATGEQTEKNPLFSRISEDFINGIQQPLTG